MAELEPPRVIITNRLDGSFWYWLAKLYGFVACIGFSAGLVLATCTYRHYAALTPPIPDLSRYRDSVSGINRIYAADGSLLREAADEWREVVALDQIPPLLVKAFLAAEDHRFFEHDGIDFKGVVRAIWANITAGTFAQGGSTITQQVAKQFLGSEKTIARKAKEAILARRLERHYSKHAILALYLNHIFLGNKAHGVSMAAKRFFAKPLGELNTGQIATIAGLAKAPTRYSPLRYPQRAIRRRNEVLDRMVRNGFLTDEQAKRWKQSPLQITPPRDLFPSRAPFFTQQVYSAVRKRHHQAYETSGWLRIETTLEPTVDSAARQTVDFGARKQDKRQGWRGPEAHLSETQQLAFRQRSAVVYGGKDLTKGRRYLALVTTVNRRGATVQIGTRSFALPLKSMKWAAAWDIKGENDHSIHDATNALSVGDVVWVKPSTVVLGKFRDWYFANGRNPRWKPPQSNNTPDAEITVELDQFPHPQSALFTADHQTGYVLTSVGGTSFRHNQHDRVWRACRQPGSTFKPIYYSRALDLGYGYYSMWNDKPRTEIDPITGEEWTPVNLDGSTNDEVTLEYALVFSKNIPSVAIFKKIGADDAKNWARKLGFTTPIIADKALALGASCTKLHELTRAFAIFARNGTNIDWQRVRRVYDGSGHLIEDNTVYFDPMLSPADRLDRIFDHAERKPEQRISPQTAYLTSRLLRNMITYGFASILRKTGIPAAGKTGTSSATMDTSFVGYTSRWITTVWLGDDLYVRPLGLKDAAYMTVVPMWARYMYEVARDQPNQEIPWHVPPGVNPHSHGGKRGQIGTRMPLVWHKTH